jgi:hypothetical protein
MDKVIKLLLAVSVAVIPHAVLWSALRPDSFWQRFTVFCFSVIILILQAIFLGFVLEDYANERKKKNE